MPPWQVPSGDYLPDFTIIGRLLEYGNEEERVVQVPLIVGSAANPKSWRRDWTLREEVLEDDPGFLAYRRSKLSRLLEGYPERGYGPITQADLLEGEDFLELHLCELEGIYFVASGGEHRVAVAHQKGFSRLKAVVTPAWFREDAPEEARRWVTSLMPPPP